MSKQSTRFSFQVSLRGLVRAEDKTMVDEVLHDTFELINEYTIAKKASSEFTVDLLGWISLRADSLDSAISLLKEIVKNVFYVLEDFTIPNYSVKSLEN